MDYERARRAMVDSQIRPNDVTDPEIVSAFITLAREAFVPSSAKSIAYSELEIETSPGRALWTPRDLAKMVKALDPKSSDFGLVIGAGAGYETAILASIIETVLGLEEDENLVSEMTDRLATQGIDSAVAVQGPLAVGLPDHGPFDLILVAGMVETVPEAWFDQLADGGRLGVVVQKSDALGSARIYIRSGQTVSYHWSFDARPPKFDGFDAEPKFAF